MPITSRISRPIEAEPEATQLKRKLVVGHFDAPSEKSDLVVEHLTNGTHNLLCLSLYWQDAKSAPLPQRHGDELSRLAIRPLDLEEGYLGFDYDEIVTHVTSSEVAAIRLVLEGEEGFSPSDPTPADQILNRQIESILNRWL